MEPLYLDHCATTPIHPEVLSEMTRVYQEAFANPSSLHQAGRMAKQTLERARERIATRLDARPEDVLFTAGGTEANTLALFGALERFLRGPGEPSAPVHLISSELEHPSVQRGIEALAERGVEVTWLPVPANGVLQPEDVERALRPHTRLVSVMLANNEIGTIQPIADIAALCRARGVLLHTDAVQAVGKIPVSFRDLGVDLLTASAHKFYGPRGVGIVVARRQARLRPILHGGGQERGLRSGTENVAAIHGAAVALDKALDALPAEAIRLQRLRDAMAKAVMDRMPEVLWTAADAPKLPHVLHLCIPGVLGEAVLLELDQLGVCVSAGSACSAGSAEPSPVLRAMGVDERYVHGGLRISLGRGNTEADVARFAEALDTAVHRLVRM
ncbi:cysteine desulfurase NifS [Alicyclobacillus contaminans]|uniref:cysteine desulfurase family protein n=1 Tax=Alicyclobacillus contaminans TaxID=392016 RepID=UPI00040D179C|nr:cysteine desulfurase family protein [Alicyclobacillus contaminans]GMA49738.1 cysteine desulfurase NifS [Alicyclobacillus contaminans]